MPLSSNSCTLPKSGLRAASSSAPNRKPRPSEATLGEVGGLINRLLTSPDRMAISDGAVSLRLRNLGLLELMKDGRSDGKFGLRAVGEIVDEDARWRGDFSEAALAKLAFLPRPLRGVVGGDVLSTAVEKDDNALIYTSPFRNVSKSSSAISLRAAS